MTLQTGEVVLIRMQFHQTQGSKVRPALVLLDTGDDDFVAAPVTSQLRTSEFDFALADWRAAGLNVPSFARVHKLTVLPKWMSSGGLVCVPPQTEQRFALLSARHSARRSLPIELARAH